MALEVIGAGLGRTATFSLKFALEHLGFGPCHHMSEVFADARNQVPLWIAAGKGNPDWDTILANFRSTSDYPACSHWRALSEYYPEAKVVLTTRSADSWFESVSETIFAPRMQASLKGSPGEELMMLNVMGVFGDRITDRAFMTDWYEKRNEEIIAALPAERLLVFHPKEGWEPLATFLGVEVPSVPFPRVNSRDELGAANDEQGGLPPDPETMEKFARAYIDQLKAKAFGG
ncbi:hypothetical protein GRI89_17670 [Altererythrobacter salegens]|uniref:Sulfotransferase family protein n=1 Tax=Croceibacterium salegens TaxID=1737568 RepID=A0A6I4SZA4_9SPHN|nr:sulfotransferase family protein [Croceibacterium salegens]MXO61374.1 hypothetical protein [Croceibacterium salegens]